MMVPKLYKYIILRDNVLLLLGDSKRIIFEGERGWVWMRLSAAILGALLRCVILF